MDRERRGLTRAGTVTLALAALVAGAGTVAYAVAGRRAPAAAHVPAAAPTAVSASVGLSAARVTYGTRVRVTGTLRDRAGAPLPGRTVEVLTAPATDPSRVTVAGTPLTDGRGEVTVSIRPAATADVWLRYPGGDGLAEAGSMPARVEVAPKVTLEVRTKRTRGGWTTTLRGRVSPARPGAGVRLDRRAAGRAWREVRVVPLSRASTYAFRVREARPGRYEYRVSRPADGTLLAAQVSRAVTLTLPRRPLPALAGRGGPRTLLVAGDSFAYYLGQQLATVRRPRETAVESRHSSGLARPDFYDWDAAARAQVRARPGAVVLFLGANDCQPVRVGGDGRWVTVGTAAWVGEYRRRAAALMRTYGGDGARPVVWVGLPIAAKRDIAACYRAINAATLGAARDVAGVAWVDSWAVYAVGGRYSEYVDGVRARQEDGIHLTYAGTRLLTRKVFAALG